MGWGKTESLVVGGWVDEWSKLENNATLRIQEGAKCDKKAYLWVGGLHMISGLCRICGFQVRK